MAVHRLFILAFAALPFLALDAAAQTTAARYRNWDRNNDGVVTRAEWGGTAREFRDLDWNGDGVLSRSELQEEEIWVPEDQDEQWDVQTFTALDRNRNGRLSRGEWRGDRQTFLRVDRNNDNQISRSEFLNANAGNVDDPITDFNVLDYDRTGLIEPDEWHGTRAAFNRLDTNNDGVLTRRELNAGDVQVASSDDFDILDRNNNGVISAGEWRLDYGNFSLFDLNRDGVISRREYQVNDPNAGVEEALIVDSRQPWTDTGIDVNVGDVVAYRATGLIQMSTNVNDRATAAGSLTGRTARNSPRPEQKAGGLLMRVGLMGNVAFLGESGTFTAPATGRLFLGVNDDHFPDNTGEYRVQLSVSPRYRQ